MLKVEPSNELNPLLALLASLILLPICGLVVVRIVANEVC